MNKSAFVKSSTNGTATNSAVKVFSKNEKRSRLLIQNQGAEAIRIGYDSGLLGTTGIKIESGGHWIEDAATPLNDIYIIRDASAAGNVAYYAEEGE